MLAASLTRANGHKIKPSQSQSKYPPSEWKELILLVVIHLNYFRNGLAYFESVRKTGSESVRKKATRALF